MCFNIQPDSFDSNNEVPMDSYAAQPNSEIAGLQDSAGTDALFVEETPTPTMFVNETWAPTEAPTVSPTGAPTPAPTPGCKEGEYLFFYNKKRVCVPCVSRDAVLFDKSGPNCVLNDQGQKCKNVAWDWGSAVCMDGCPSGSVTYPMGHPTCTTTNQGPNKGQACKVLVWSAGKPVCMDPCTWSAMVWGPQGPKCVLDSAGDPCSRVVWGAGGASCADQPTTSLRASSSPPSTAEAEAEVEEAGKELQRASEESGASGCQNVAWSGQKRLCFDDCPGGLDSVVWAQGEPRCMLNDQGEGCGMLAWSGEDPVCMDHCGADDGDSMAYIGMPQSPAFVKNSNGLLCNNIVWDGPSPLCSDSCAGVEYDQEGHPTTCLWKDGSTTPLPPTLTCTGTTIDFSEDLMDTVGEGFEGIWHWILGVVTVIAAFIAHGCGHGCCCGCCVH
eukprot:CAMPEP_0113942580 /NCGR_PEP_ID=MMETSP1339-20121228/8264_1 /TAXON_ID=94617 /ORGANISM="Fibrocapsa japonica" /LENGTH=441 /DNA_ID=CAMNT_0000947103 /DNA_START=265 /DNA_END=1590 /DNA_ORIENTATION=+ /assembly_acc=CAM_ASM_000762